METRTLEQVKIYTLVLNDMRSAKIENLTLTPYIATEMEVLEEWVESQMSDGKWQDGNWSKVFKKGSELEWFNRPSDLDGLNNEFGEGIRWEWVEQEQLEILLEDKRVIDVTTFKEKPAEELKTSSRGNVLVDQSEPEVEVNAGSGENNIGRP